MEETDRLQDKVAIVTGAGSRGTLTGIGQATSILFARHGAKVVLSDMDMGRAEETLSIIEGEGGQATVFQADVTSEDDCIRLVEYCTEHYGALHILFNNVGTNASGMVTEIEESDLDHSLSVNLKSMVWTCKHTVPKMAQSGGGSIINISSIDGIRAGSSHNVAYGVAKGGVVTLTRHMAVHHGREGIRVNCIAPGHLYAPFVSHISEELRESRRKAGPLGTEGNAWDVAWAAVFLASDEARWISGVVLPIDAGLFAATPLSVLDNLKT